MCLSSKNSGEMVALILLVVISCLSTASAAEWNYDEQGHDWRRDFGGCAENRQSPVNIEFATTRFSDDLGPFDNTLFNFNQGGQFSNNGHSISFGFDGWTIPAGTANFTDSYKAVNLHLHWGSRFGPGSEHSFNGEQSYAEMHFVHFNTKYGTLGDAVDKTDGLAVLGIMVVQRRGIPDNEAFQQLLEPMTNLTYKGDSIAVDNFEFGGLFPTYLSHYFRYPGSLTTPLCFQSVTWTVFRDVVYISERQANALADGLFEYSSTTEANRKIINNFRVVQPLNGRTVYTSQQRASGAVTQNTNVLLMVASLILSILTANLF